MTPDMPKDVLRDKWANPPSQFITVNGIEYHVRDEGARDDPLPLVLLHGTGSSLYTWDDWVARLKDHRRLIRFDRPGFGLTGAIASNDYTMPGSAKFLAELLDALRVERCIVVGNSSGGRLAWTFAVAHPQRVTALVLLAPGGYPRTSPLPLGLRVARSRFFTPLLERILPIGQVRKGLESTYGDPSKVTDVQVQRNYELALFPGNRRTLGETLRQSEDDFSGDIPKVKAPTLILWGELDNVIPAGPDAQRFVGDIKGSKLVMLPGVGHLPQEEVPEQTADAADEWLKALAVQQ